MKNHLFIGLGGFGGRTLAEIRKCEFLNKELVAGRDTQPNTSYLYLDSSMDVLGDLPRWNVMGNDVRLSQADVIKLKDNVLNLDAVKDLEHITEWLGSPEYIESMLAGSGRGVPGANQRRRFGRFLFKSNAEEFHQKFLSKINAGGVAECTIHIFATLAGGTGSGALLDVITIIRENFSNTEKYPIFVYAYATDRPQDNPSDPHFFFANQFSVIRDLNALATGRYQPQNLLKSSISPVSSKHLYFNNVYLITPLNDAGIIFGPEDQVKAVGQWVYHAVMAEVYGYLDQTAKKIFTGEDVLAGGFDAEAEPDGKKSKSLRFASIGLQSWRIPEHETREALSLDCLNQVLLQNLYNNWDSEYGYQDTSGQNILKHEDVLKELSFSTDDDWILSNVDGHPTYESEWVKAQSNVGLVDGVTSSVNALAEHLSDYAARSFRGSGIKSYFKTRKENAQRGDAFQLGREIAQWLDKKWLSGEMGLSELDETLKQFANGLEQMDQSFKERAERIKVPNISEAKTKWINHAGSIGWLARLFNAEEKLLNACRSEMTTIYIQQCKYEGLIYASTLAQELSAKVADMQSALSKTYDACKALIDEVESARKPLLAGIKNHDNDTEGRGIIEFDQDAYDQVWKRMKKDKARINQMARECRSSALEDGVQIDGLYAENQDELFNKMFRVVEPLVKGAHDEACNDRSLKDKRVLGRNILNVFAGSLTPRMREKIEGFMASSMTLAEQGGDPSPVEVDSTLDATSSTIPRDIIMALRPDGGDEKLIKEMEEKLTTCNAHGRILIKDNGNPHELVCLTAYAISPARMFKIVHNLRQKYEACVEQDKYRYFCHLDDKAASGDTHPNLFRN